MVTNQQLEERIRDVLATETQAIRLSNQLFSPQGLFAQLAPTEAERRAVSQSELFRAAQSRLSELQQEESRQFAATVNEAKAKTTANAGLYKFEGTEVVSLPTSLHQ